MENSLPFAIATSDDEENIKVELEENTNDILNDIDFSEIDELMQKMGISLGGAADFKAMIADVIAGKEVFSFDLLFQNLKSQFGDLLKEILSPLVMILVIILLCNLMSSLAPARTSGSVSDVIYFACLAVIVIIVSVLVRDIILVSKETIEGLSGQLNAIYPIIITLLTAVGSVQSVATFSPIMVFFSGTLMNIFAGVLFPIFTFLIVSTI
ncbi:MAG: hypothetical protein IJW24_01010, partial [Clostridia bacterium]|nr:hypothetical protein [Clostridia bacterium]